MSIGRTTRAPTGALVAPKGGCLSSPLRDGGNGPMNRPVPPRRWYDEFGGNPGLVEEVEGREWDPVLSRIRDVDEASRWSNSAAEAELQRTRREGALMLLDHPWREILDRVDFDAAGEVLVEVPDKGDFRLCGDGHRWREIRQRMTSLGARRPGAVFFALGGREALGEQEYLTALRSRFQTATQTPEGREALRRAVLGENPGPLGNVSAAAVARCWATVAREFGGDAPTSPPEDFW